MKKTKCKSLRYFFFSILLLIILSVFVYIYYNPFAYFDCNNGNSVLYDYYDNGNIKQKSEKDKFCKFHGLVSDYYPNGNIKSNVYYQHGARHGEGRFYNEFGHLYKFDSCEMNQIYIYSQYIDDSNKIEINLRTNKISHLLNEEQVISKELKNKNILLFFFNEHPIHFNKRQIFIEGINDYCIYNLKLELIFSLQDSIKKVDRNLYCYLKNMTSKDVFNVSYKITDTLENVLKFDFYVDKLDSLINCDFCFVLPPAD